MRSSQRVLVHIKFCYFYPPGVLGGQFIENRRRKAARPAPGRPAIHYDGTFLSQYLSGEGSISYIQGIKLSAHDNQGSAATSAKGAIVKAVFGHPVFLAAIEASDYHIIEVGTAASAHRAMAHMFLRNAILGTAIEASYNQIFLPHGFPRNLFVYYSHPGRKSQSIFRGKWSLL